ncbi:ABC transporter ATP-binding protein [Pseudoalteromonas piscicida]|uniref:ABC transporter ATP-binding protein n=1 Tax=Pseudoalteromonas piscicida TaxID=43662 RepID=A0A2A5JTV8_PSEO7|nr:ABC transporter ATP-binding protein [Pseudoalteromonas piscicida]PCK32865.1 ABC transporter ATP-binding protein [Pseudoalteromonas piscicida]
MNSVIQLNNIEKRFQTDEIATQALDGINLLVEPGEFVAITGPSGCGKSTLLSILGLIDEPSNGEYFISGNPAFNLNSDERAHIRANHIGFIFQAFNLISDLNVLENVMLPLTYIGGISQKEMEQKAKDALAMVGLENRINHFPSQLSGGQQQRAAVARALINSPDLILADEPTGNLDSNNAQQVLGLLSELHAAGKTICMVTHDIESTTYASRVISMLDGTILRDKKQLEHASKVVGA